MLDLLRRNLGHEIRNPLGGIRGAAQMMAAELGDHYVLIREGPPPGPGSPGGLRSARVWPPSGWTALAAGPRPGRRRGPPPPATRTPTLGEGPLELEAHRPRCPQRPRCLRPRARGHLEHVLGHERQRSGVDFWRTAAIHHFNWDRAENSRSNGPHARVGGSEAARVGSLRPLQRVFHRGRVARGNLTPRPSQNRT